MTAPPVAARSLPPATHRLLTLGSAGLYDSATGTLILGPGKPLALLTYLALAPGRRASRESLIDLLWSDMDPDRGRAALRQILFHLRRLLGEEALPGSGELTLRHGLATDRDEFLGALEAGDLEEAVRRYGGAFLPDFGVPGGVAFEHWADLERARLQAAYLRAVEMVVRRLLNQARFREAQHLARQARDEAPGTEATWRLLLEAIVAGRDFVAAAVEAEALEAWAAMGQVGLEPATRAAIARARRVSPEAGEVAAGAAGLVAELTGREREFAAITAAWDAVRAGGWRQVHLSAPAGLGKTRLLQDTTARLRAAGAAIAEVRASPGEREIPLAFAADLAQALAQLPGAAGIAPASAAVLVRLNPALSARLPAASPGLTGEDPLRNRIQALADLAHAVAEEQPVVLVMDDLHWVDADSFRLLEGLAGRLSAARVLCLSAARPERRPPGAAPMILSLPPLTAPQVASLVTALGAMPVDEAWGGDFSRRLHQATAGSPLLVLETLRLAMDEGVLRRVDGEWQCPDPARLGGFLREGAALRQRILALPRDLGHLLGLLATAGTPLSAEGLARAAGRDAGTVTAMLGELERLGLVARAGADWQAAHDEVADAARNALDEPAQVHAHLAIGELLAGDEHADRHRLLRALRHFASAGESGRLRTLFRRYAWLARVHGDRRSLAELASEAIGEPSGSAGTRALRGAVPLPWRLGLWSPARQAAALAAATLALGGSVGLPMVREARDAALPRVLFLDSAGVAFEVVGRRELWDGRPDEVMPRRATTTLADAARTYTQQPPSLSPDGRSLAWNQTVGDSTTIDIWIRTPAGTRRLTREVRDDLVYGWLPDGSGLVGVSHRWSDRTVGGYDIAVFDTATGAARQVTRGREHDGQPFVSPEGTRIAFRRESLDGPTALCIVPFDGAGEPSCRLPAGEEVGVLLGWSNRDELVVVTQLLDRNRLVRYAWDTGATTVLVENQVYNPQLSPDRRWVLASVRAPGVSGTRDWIIPVDQPSAARRVRHAQGGVVVPRWWEGSAPAEGLVDRVEFADTGRTILPGVGRRLALRALTAEGTEVPIVAPVRWHASDTLIAVVDSLGQVHPRGIGRVTIEASLAGWRRVREEFEVAGAAPSTQLDEEWDDSWRERWITFGYPHPEVTTGPGGLRAFWNRGDGIYVSTGILRRAFGAGDGLGVEVRMSTPVTRSDWLRARVALVAGLDTASLLGANQRGAAPSLGDVDRYCGAAYPGGMGDFGARSLFLESAGGGGRLDLGPDAALLRSGAWWTLRVQVLPDGRCGVALNGRPVWISSQPIRLDRPLWLRIGDESASARLLHGPLTIWTGVRTDVDWTRLAGAVPAPPGGGSP